MEIAKLCYEREKELHPTWTWARISVVEAM